jgi:hypothetical protein
VGYRLAPAHWGKGYATEAAAALVRYGFLTLNLPLITAIAQAENAASNRVLRKVGLVYQKTYTLDGLAIHFHSLARAGYGPGGGPDDGHAGANLADVYRTRPDAGPAGRALE